MTLYNVDCLEYMKTVPDNTFDLIIADPPYFKIVDDEWDNQWKSEEEYLEWCMLWTKECERILKHNGSLYVWGGVGEKSISFLKHIILVDEQTNLIRKNWITWHKKRGIGGNRNWMYTREELVFFVKSRDYTFNVLYSNSPGTSNASKKKFTETGRGKRLSNVWNDILEMGWNNTGPCKMSAEKSVKLGERIVLASTNENDLVYIPFAGSGSEIEACIKTRRQWIATETHRPYIDEIIMPRISDKN